MNLNGINKGAIKKKDSKKSHQNTNYICINDNPCRNTDSAGIHQVTMNFGNMGLMLASEIRKSEATTVKDKNDNSNKYTNDSNDKKIVKSHPPSQIKNDGFNSRNILDYNLISINQILRLAIGNNIEIKCPEISINDNNNMYSVYFGSADINCYSLNYERDTVTILMEFFQTNIFFDEPFLYPLNIPHDNKLYFCSKTFSSFEYKNIMYQTFDIPIDKHSNIELKKYWKDLIVNNGLNIKSIETYCNHLITYMYSYQLPIVCKNHESCKLTPTIKGYYMKTGSYNIDCSYCNILLLISLKIYCDHDIHININEQIMEPDIAFSNLSFYIYITHSNNNKVISSKNCTALPFDHAYATKIITLLIWKVFPNHFALCCGNISKYTKKLILKTIDKIDLSMVIDQIIHNFPFLLYTLGIKHFMFKKEVISELGIIVKRMQNMIINQNFNLSLYSSLTYIDSACIMDRVMPASKHIHIINIFIDCLNYKNRFTDVFNLDFKNGISKLILNEMKIKPKSIYPADNFDSRYRFICNEDVKFENLLTLAGNTMISVFSEKSAHLCHIMRTKLGQFYSSVSTLPDEVLIHGTFLVSPMNTDNKFSIISIPPITLKNLSSSFT